MLPPLPPAPPIPPLPPMPPAPPPVVVLMPDEVVVAALAVAALLADDVASPVDEVLPSRFEQVQPCAATRIASAPHAAIGPARRRARLGLTSLMLRPLISGFPRLATR